MMTMMMMMIVYLAAADAVVAGAPDVHTWLRCIRRDTNIVPARRTCRHFDKDTASSFLQRQHRLDSSF